MISSSNNDRKHRRDFRLTTSIKDTKEQRQKDWFPFQNGLFLQLKTIKDEM